MRTAAPHSERYAHLVARGQIRLVAATTADLDRVPVRDATGALSPLDILLTDRERDPCPPGCVGLPKAQPAPRRPQAPPAHLDHTHAGKPGE
ncbi:hypothetical protein [Streptomyces sp. NRRL F-5123]|uniref:hypothetical protein n=1 Tax=Streptomyces sp. NRRL F-5123 TaxID=1463856 RepID=UPI00131D207C|nr:hypothetical protein [Streptomyces sp. NRRL F-5123]